MKPYIGKKKPIKLVQTLTSTIFPSKPKRNKAMRPRIVSINDADKEHASILSVDRFFKPLSETIPILVT